jgi:hypothetical protein
MRRLNAAPRPRPGCGTPGQVVCQFTPPPRSSQGDELALYRPDVEIRFADLGGVMLSESPADFAKLITEETEKWSKVIRAAKIKPD